VSFYWYSAIVQYFKRILHFQSNHKKKIKVYPMKINTLLVCTMASLLAITSVYAEGDGGAGEGTGGTEGMTSGDTQTATITIPEVSMIDVTGSVSATLTPPTDAGENFEKTVINERISYSISTNIEANSTQKRQIIATSNDIPAGWKIYITMGAPTASGRSSEEKELTHTNTSQVLVQGIKNVAEQGIAMTMSVGPEDSNTMPSHNIAGAIPTTIVYTITAGS
jgi:hypothetical protein